jgi:hypothetical protein
MRYLTMSRTIVKRRAFTGRNLPMRKCALCDRSQCARRENVSRRVFARAVPDDVKYSRAQHGAVDN